jgi:hypothetical protein
MNNTPETDNIARGNHVVLTKFAQQLKRERDEAIELHRKSLREREATEKEVDAMLMRAQKAECERDKYEEDLVMIVDAILRRNGRGVFDMSAIDRLAELHTAERERYEARQQEQIHYDNTLAMQKERDEARGKYLKEKEELDKTLDELVEARGRIAGISGQLLCSAFYVGKLEKENAQLRAIAEAAVDWLNLGNPDDVRAGLHIRAKLDQLNEEGGK